jgi:protein-S-isoprenylcysteine O-methyltransferase Ste14
MRRRFLTAFEWEYRWRAIPLFLSQGVVLGAHFALTQSFALPVSNRAGLTAVAMGFAGLGLRVWGTGILSANTMVSMTLTSDRLATGGPFSLVRNPLYLGDLLLFSAYGLMLGPELAVAFAVFHLLRVYRLILYEEEGMRARWGRQFDDYTRAVPRLIPRIAVPAGASVEWREAIAASAIWAGFAFGYLASWITGDLWALAPIETAGFVFAAFYFSRLKLAARQPADV